MAPHRKKNSLRVTRTDRGLEHGIEAARPGSRLKLWWFRLTLLILAPVLAVAFLELGLRLAGFGYPTSFLLPSVINGKAVFTQNDRFGFRFFGPTLARQPFPFRVPRAKPPDTIRVFVFGESAAYGDPQPEFGLPRMLQTLLSLRYPEVRFEVVNAAMTGINSHVVLPIARDCAAAQGDIWVVYMGNNEVVGPFGAGTVFGPQAPGLALIRATLGLKTTRTGQLFDWLFQHLHPPPADKSEWGGMLMFLEHLVRQNDPRMEKVYKHFEHNLSAILEVGRANRVGIVVGTVAVNLKDCAPFASLARTSLSEQAKSNWTAMFRRGLELQKAARHDDALECFHQAEQQDDAIAELQFAIAQSCLATGKSAEAQRRFELARDLDALRFRCDSRLNQITRQVCTNREPERIRLADPEKAFARESRDGVPGAEFFYEHVHLTFEGNYQLARTFAEQITKLLPEAVRGRADAESRAWPNAEDCARRLGWTDFQRLTAVEDMLGRLSDPPFTAQLNHVDQITRLSQLDEQLRAGAQPGLAHAAAACREALKSAPVDAILYQQLATVLSTSGDLTGAAEAAHRMTDLLPNSSLGWMLLGGILSRDHKYEEALRAFGEAVRFDSQRAWALYNLGLIYDKLGRRAAAIEQYRQALRIKPRLGPAWLALGESLEAEGHKQEAEQDYRMAVRNRVLQPKELVLLAEFCQSRGWVREAATNYLDAIKLRPNDALLHLKAGQCLEQLGQHAEAEGHYAEAVRLAPASGQAHFLLGLTLGRQGKPAEAAEQFKAAVRLMPEVTEARFNLAIALLDQGRKAEALDEFREVLRRNPTNAIALRNVKALEAR